MNAVFRQALANMRGHRLQAVLVFLTLFASAALLTVALSTLRTAQGAYDRLFERTHGAHAWFYLRPDGVTAQHAEQVIASIEGIEASTGVMRHLPGELFAGGESLDTTRLREWPGETPSVAQILLVAGRGPLPGELQAIVLDRNYAVEQEIGVGDSVDLRTPQGLQSLAVIGLHVTSETCPYPNCSPPVAFLAQGAFDALELSTKPKMGGWVVGIRLGNPSDLQAVVRSAMSEFPPQSVSFWDSWLGIRAGAGASIEFQRILLITFGIVAGLAAGFLMANAVAEAARTQTRQIGLLKAVGFTNGQLSLVYLVEYLGMALVASSVGLVVGSLLAMVVLQSLAARFGEALLRPSPWIVVATPACTLLLATVFTLGPVRHAAGLDVVQAIRVGAESPRRSGARLTRLPLPLALALSDLACRPLRSTLTVLTLAMAAITMSAALILATTIRTITSDPTMGGIVDGDLFIFRSVYMEDAEARGLIEAQREVLARYSERWWQFQFLGEDEKLNARFRDGDLGAFRFPVIEGRMFAHPDEALVGYGLANERDLHPGDLLTILLDGEQLKLTVSGIYRENSNNGRMLTLPADILRRVHPEAMPYRYVVKLRPGADPQAVADALVASSPLLDVVTAAAGERPTWIVLLPRVMAALSLVLVGIAVLGVLNSLWMAVRERGQAFAILKTVGMTPQQVVQSVLLGAMGMGLAGYILGVALGVGGIRLLMDRVARQVGYGPLVAPVDWGGLILLLPAVLLVAAVGAWLPARRAGRSSVIDVLRHE